MRVILGSFPSYYGRTFLSVVVNARTTAFTDLFHGFFSLNSSINMGTLVLMMKSNLGLLSVLNLYRFIESYLYIASFKFKLMV